MLNRIVDLSLRFRAVVLALACVVIGYGVFIAGRVKLDVFPEFVPPQVDVQTEAPGLAAEQVEMLVTRPVESALTGVGHLESIRSESIQGLSVITAVFREGADIFVARQMLGEKLAELAGELPFRQTPSQDEPQRQASRHRRRRHGQRETDRLPFVAGEQLIAPRSFGSQT